MLTVKVIFSPYFYPGSFKNIKITWLKQTKLFALSELGSQRGSTSASLKIGENLAFRKNLASFLKLGVSLILRYLLTDLLLIKTKLALVRPDLIYLNFIVLAA